MTPADEMRTAAGRLRDDRNCNNQRLDSGSRELLEMIAALLRAREPLADWLDRAAESYDAGVRAATSVWPHDETERATFIDDVISPDHALALARAINSGLQAGHVQGGRIVDRLDPAELLNSRKDA